jgi:hypothetical protein
VTIVDFTLSFAIIVGQQPIARESACGSRCHLGVAKLQQAQTFDEAENSSVTFSQPDSL